MRRNQVMKSHGLALRSAGEGPFDVPTLAADVARWLDEQPEPAWVVGLSLGAMVALELALQLPHKVQGLVLVNGFSEFLLETPKEQERYAMRLKWLRWFGMRPLAWWLGRELFPGPDLAQVRHTFRGRFVRNKKKTYKALLEALPGWSVRARLGTLWQPVAIISTSHDYLPLARRVEQFASLPNATILNAKGDSLRRRWEGNFAGASAPLVLNVLLDHLQRCSAARARKVRA
ncbi:alpha/beta fold hydrolase [Aeromonas caviae]